MTRIVPPFLSPSAARESAFQHFIDEETPSDTDELTHLQAATARVLLVHKLYTQWKEEKVSSTGQIPTHKFSSFYTSHSLLEKDPELRHTSLFHLKMESVITLFICLISLMKETVEAHLYLMITKVSFS